MKDIFQILKDWTRANKKFAIATVIKTWGSSPRPIGSNMIISEEQEMAGSVSGGCVEGAVVKASKEVIGQNRGMKISFGVSNEDAWEVGLSCGGSLEVYLESFLSNHHKDSEREAWQQLDHCLSNNEACILLTQLKEGQTNHFLVLPNGKTYGKKQDTLLVDLAINTYNQRKNQIIEFEDKQYFVQVFPRKSQLLIIGAAHISVDLVELAKRYDFETIVIDPRGTFAQKTQFTTPPDQIIEKYPEEVLHQFSLDAYTYAVVLSHDPKIDDNALQILLKSEVAYIGALGSRKNQAKRAARMEAAGFSSEQISRIHGPIGLDINAKKPSEIALSIMGEIIKIQNQFI